jgi:hypothetical protein
MAAHPLKNNTVKNKTAARILCGRPFLMMCGKQRDGKTELAG